MKIYQSKIILFFLLGNLSTMSQTGSSSKAANVVYDWRLSVTGGVTHLFDESRFINKSLNYLQYRFGYIINEGHEIGLETGKVYPTPWYAIYYRFNFPSLFVSLSLGSLDGFENAYESVSLGKELKLGAPFFLNLGLSYSRLVDGHLLDFKSKEKKLLTASIGLSIKL